MTVNKILLDILTFKDFQIKQSCWCEGSGDCSQCPLFDCYYNETNKKE